MEKPDLKDFIETNPYCHGNENLGILAQN